jgi:hypothetical protein
MKVRVKVQPLGLLNQQPWPEAGELVDLPDAVAEDMIRAGTVEAVKAEKPKAETRPAPKEDVETRKAPAKKTAAKKS